MFDLPSVDSTVLMERGDEFCADVDEAPSDIVVRPYSEIPTSGWLGVELDIATEDPGSLGDADLVEAIVAFDRMASWAAAR